MKDETRDILGRADRADTLINGPPIETGPSGRNGWLNRRVLALTSHPQVNPHDHVRLLLHGLCLLV